MSDNKEIEISQLDIEKLSPERRKLFELLKAKQKKNRTTFQSVSPFSLISDADRLKMPAGVEDAYPAGMVQLGMLYHMEFDGDSTTPADYHNVSTIRMTLDCNYDHGLFEKAVNVVVANQPNCRTSFDLVNYSEPLQLIHALVPIVVGYEDLRNESELVQVNKIKEFIKRENFNPIDTTKVPLIRFYIHHIADNIVSVSFTEPHSIADGWSLHLTFVDIVNAYVSFQDGIEFKFAPLKTSYSDFINEERKILACEKAIAFWDQKLAECVETELPRLPMNCEPDEKTLVDSHRGRFTLAEEVVQALQKIVERTGIPLKAIFLAAHCRMLGIVTGKNKVTTGISFNGRLEVDTGDQVRGMFLNTLPITLDLSGGTWLELIEQAHKAELEIIPYRRYPLGALQSKFGEKSIFGTMVSFLHFHSIESTLKNGKIKIVPTEDLSKSNFDLAGHFHMDPNNKNHIQFIGDADLDKVSRAQFLTMMDYYQRILNELAFNPEGNYRSNNFLSIYERRKVINEWTTAEISDDQNIYAHELFEARVELTPQNIAIVYADQHLTYRDLNNKANQLAHYLIEKGVGPETMVALCVERSLDMVVALLAILKAGGAYVPLDPWYPKDRLAYFLEDSKAAVVITQQHLLDRLPASIGKIVCLDETNTRQSLAKNSQQNIAPQNIKLNLRNLAYVIYTSGSTGKPKGVMIEHTAFTALLLAAKEVLSLNEETRWLTVTTIAFDIAGLEIFGPLISGGCAFICSTEQSRDGGQLSQLLQKFHINIMQATPASWQVLLDYGWEGNSELSVLCGGDILPLSVASQLRLLCKRLINCYGPTEATIWSHMAEVDVLERSIPLKGLLPGYQCYVVGEEFTDEIGTKCVDVLPIGVAGELLLGGVGLSRGYLYQSQLTDQKFKEYALHDKPVQRLYKTGDLVRWQADGSLEFMGRIDNQVKIRGFRIELGEIEFYLNKCEGIKESVVVIRGDGENKRLIAFFVCKAEIAGVDTRELIVQLQKELSQFLPAHMIPAAFVVMESLPLTFNGKVNRNALPEVNMSEQVATDYVAPRTEQEKILCDIWQKIFGLDQIGIDDNFFNLGGHSLFAVRLAAKIRENLGVDFQLKSIFQSPTIRTLSATLQTATAGPLRKLITRVGNGVEFLPLSFAQQRIWVLSHLEENGEQFNMPAVFRVEGHFDLDAAEAAINRIIRRHESLRTIFIEQTGRPVQLVQQKYHFSLSRYDLTDLNPEQQNVNVQELIITESLTRFDLTKDVLVRASYLQLSEKPGISEGVLLFNMHHIASDGWSLGLLVDEFVQQYQAAAKGEQDPLPELDLQYSDYAYWQRHWLQGEVLDQQLGYWITQLTGMPSIHNVPLDHPRPKIQSFRGDIYSSHIHTDVLTRLNKFCFNKGATLFMGLHAALAALLGRYSNETDIVIGSPTANREQAEVAKLIGCFINNLVLRSDLSNARCFDALVEQSKTMLLNAYAHQQVPFEKIVEALQPERSLSYSPLFQIMLVLQNNDAGELALPGLQLSPIRPAISFAKYDITLNVEENNNGLQLDWEYNKDLFEPETIAQLANHFESLLNGMLANPLDDIFTIDLLSDAEKYQQLIGWNSTDVDYPNNKCIHNFFEKQVSANPNAVAVVYQNQQLTYKDLNQKANQLARHLVLQGVKPDSLVGICLERSPQMMIGLLAILKAGGAYVPMDPAYPISRLQYMIEDSQCVTLITQTDVAAFLSDVLPDKTICLDEPSTLDALQKLSIIDIDTDVGANNLAYVIYTSGSTGKPKGVMVEHKNVINFFTALDQRFESKERKNWLALTSISFDISVLELFWTLANGDKIILSPDRAKPAENVNAIDFSLFYFAAEEAGGSTNKYRLLLEGARFADEHNLAGVWVPERHFHNFGDQYPNPSVAAAAVAAITKNIKIRSGSVVLPLHDPIRVAEEWSMVDNLSNGRVEMSIASGWHPNDFVFAPDDFKNRHKIMRDKLFVLHELWQGNSCSRINGIGQEIDIIVHPAPIQPKLPTWITAAGSPDTFEYAGSIGANVLTHLLGQTIEELREKIAIYRRALAQHGFDPRQGKVALMIHTFIGEDMETVRAVVELPFKNYLRHSISLIKPIAEERGLDLETDLEALIDMGYQRYFHESGLFGTVESAFSQCQKLRNCDIDEFACLIDFGIEHSLVLDNLPLLKQLQIKVKQQQKQDEFLYKKMEEHSRSESFADVILNQQVSHIQCTPSLAQEFVAIVNDRDFNHRIKAICIGGEAFPETLATRLTRAQDVAIYNMYGPTETTVWSSITRVIGSNIHLSGPIANTYFYVMRKNQLLPIGVAGELYIGGEGVTRGYLHRPELTEEKFIANPFANYKGRKSCDRLYRTGDLVRWLPNGSLEFLGRIDYQVKIRGFRIELGEIEQALLSEQDVKEAVVVAKLDSSGDQQLVAYVVNENSLNNSAQFTTTLRYGLEQTLPDYMVPAAFVVLEALPLTPNGKVDRNALPDINFAIKQVAYIAPQTTNEKILCDIWQDLLGIEKIGVNDNFFELGGHSLQVMQLISRLQQNNIAMTARHLFESPRLIDLAGKLDSSNIHAAVIFQAPTNVINEHTSSITPEMLPLVELTQEDIDLIVAQVPNGVSNIQDIYPLGPLQQGVLFHHQMSLDHDPYIMSFLFEIASETSIKVVLEGLQFIVDRHDVLRTAVLWEGLTVPVQVVYRKAVLPVTYLDVDDQISVQEYMESLCAPERQWMEINEAPLLKVQLAFGKKIDRYYLLLQFHHTVSDHVGFEIIQREIAAYKAGLTNLLPTPTPYREFVAHTLHLSHQRDANGFFSNMLGDVQESTLPFGLVDVRGNGSRIHRMVSKVPDEVVQKIRAIAKSQHISPAAIFHTAWAMVIAACSGSRDVVFGTVLSGRLQGTLGVENMMGVFINTLPMRVKLNNMGVMDTVLQIQQSLVDLIPFEHASLSEAQRCSGLKGGAPLFSAILNYRHSARERSEIQGASFEENEFRFLAGEERTNYPFNLSVDELGDGFDLDMQIDDSICVSRVTGYMQVALEKLAHSLSLSPKKLVNELSVLSEEELSQQLFAWNRTEQDFPKELCIHELFEQQAINSPKNIALIFEGQQLTYAALNQQANRLAHYLLKERGLKPDALVGVCLERSLDMVIAILGILKAGGAYVPLDPHSPPVRLTHMLDDADLSTLLTHRCLLEKLPVNNKILCLDDKDFKETLNGYAVTNPGRSSIGLESNHLAYVIYTSGSTGKPKGVLCTHQALVNRILWMQAEYKLTPQDSVLQKTPYTFDVSVWEFTWPLTQGGRLVIAKPEGHKDPEYLHNIIQQQQISILHFVPSMLSTLISVVDWGQCTSVKQVFCSGEALPLSLQKYFFATGTRSQLHNLYGPTEAAIDVSFWSCDESADLSFVPIGKPIANIQLYVLDALQQPQPTGATGELYIGGVGLARGYLNRPELTAEKFIANPFFNSTYPGSSERLYKTGDLARWLPDGNLEYLGRIDSQVKIRGFRIELGEIEYLLSSCNGVAANIVLSRDDKSGQKRLVAYVVPKQDLDVSEHAWLEQLKVELHVNLPDYMLPSAYVALPKIPLTANGKVDRHALLNSDINAMHGVLIAPETETESILVEVWGRLLGLASEKISVTESFFMLGGHSLLAVRLANELGKRFKLSISVKIIFDHHSVRDIANHIDGLLASQSLKNTVMFDVSEFDSDELVEI